MGILTTYTVVSFGAVFMHRCHAISRTEPAANRKVVGDADVSLCTFFGLLLFVLISSDGSL